MWVTKLLISEVKKRIFCPKTTKFGPKLAFLVNLGQAMQAYSMPCCGLVGGCGARAVSRKTPIYFMIHLYLQHCKATQTRTFTHFIHATTQENVRICTAHVLYSHMSSICSRTFTLHTIFAKNLKQKVKMSFMASVTSARSQMKF